MIKPYTAVGLIPTVRGIRKRKDIQINLEHLSPPGEGSGSWLSSLDLPVRLIAVPRGRAAGLQRRGAGPRPRAVRARVRHRHPGRGDGGPGQDRQGVRRLRHGPGQGAPSRSQGPLLQRRVHPQSRAARSSSSTTRSRRSSRSSTRCARTTSTTGGWRSTGATCRRFWPVVDTEIGRLGIMMANEGSYPENARARWP